MNQESPEEELLEKARRAFRAADPEENGYIVEEALRQVGPNFEARRKSGLRSLS